jgi:hypothetical protein
MRIASGGTFPFVRIVRSIFLFLLTAAALLAEVPPALDAALRAFRADGPPGWSFTQKTVAGNESLLERYDASKLDFERWSLLEKNGRPASADEQRDYTEKQTRRSRGGTAPKITDSLDLATIETLSATAERTVYRCRLKRTDASDKTAEFLRATLTMHPPTQTIETFELASSGEFSPSVIVKIREMKTTLTFSVPTADRPSLLLGVSTRLRGRAFLFKSLDQDMVVTRSDYAPAFPRR